MQEDHGAETTVRAEDWPRISVVVPTYRRPTALAACLEGLSRQQRPPLEVLVVVRHDGDHETLNVIQRWSERCIPAPKLQTVSVTRPGIQAALEAGIGAAKGDVVAFTDDDAVAHPDWLERMASHYQSRSDVGGVGGRDVVHEGGHILEGQVRQVGRVTWFGRVIGNHHLESEGVRDVDVLKGVNMSVLRSLCQFPYTVGGIETQAHWEVALCMRARYLSWRLLYDANMLVDHYCAQRRIGDERLARGPEAVAHVSYNIALPLLLYASWWQRGFRLAYRFFVGDKESVGVLRAMVSVGRHDGCWRNLWPSWRGVVRAMIDCHRKRSNSRVEALVGFCDKSV